MHPLSLHHLTAMEASPAELVDIAARLRCPHVGVFVQHSGRPNIDYPLIEPGPGAREVRRRLDATGVTVHNLEAFLLRPQTEIAAFEPALALGASLGAARLTVIVGDPELDRAFEAFSRLCALAAGHGLAVHIEFHAFSHLRTFGAARDFLARGRPANASLAADVLHLYRNDGGLGPLRGRGETPIGYAQICDGPLSIDPAAAFAEAIGNRGVPGEGAFDLPAFVGLLPPGIVLDIEVPSLTLRERGLDAFERARLVVAATRSCLGAAAAA